MSLLPLIVYSVFIFMNKDIHLHNHNTMIKIRKFNIEYRKRSGTRGIKGQTKLPFCYCVPKPGIRILPGAGEALLGWEIKIWNQIGENLSKVAKKIIQIPEGDGKDSGICPQYY